MRSLATSVVLAAGLAASLTAQSGEAPVFRSGVELLEVDVSVVASSTGQFVTDLKVPDFTVLVDGKPREVISSEYVSDIAPQTKAGFHGAGYNRESVALSHGVHDASSCDRTRFERRRHPRA